MFEAEVEEVGWVGGEVGEGGVVGGSCGGGGSGGGVGCHCEDVALAGGGGDILVVLDLDGDDGSWVDLMAWTVTGVVRLWRLC